MDIIYIDESHLIEGINRYDSMFRNPNNGNACYIDASSDKNTSRFIRLKLLNDEQYILKVEWSGFTCFPRSTK